MNRVRYTEYGKEAKDVPGSELVVVIAVTAIALSPYHIRLHSIQIPQANT